MKSYSLSEYLLFSEALFFIYVSKIIIIVIPFKKIILSFKKTKTTRFSNSGSKDLIDSVGKAIERASKRTIYKSKCYDQALAAKFMFSRRKIRSTIYFGARLKDSGIDAHAWLSCCDFIVTGARVAEEYTILMKIPS